MYVQKSSLAAIFFLFSWFACTSDEALHWRTLPKKLLVVGGGVIGCELACAMQAFGVDVTIVEMLPNIVPLEEEEVSRELAKAFKKQGINVLTNHKVVSLEAKEGKLYAEIDLNKIIAAKRSFDAVGHYPRPDVFNY